MGLIFYSEINEIARIGDTTTHPNRQLASTMIDLAENEIWCGVSTSRSDGYMEHFQLMTARLE